MEMTWRSPRPPTPGYPGARDREGNRSCRSADSPHDHGNSVRRSPSGRHGVTKVSRVGSTRVGGMSAITAARARRESSPAAATSAAADRRAFLDGVGAMVPLLLGVAPFGLVIGVTVAELGLPRLAGWSLGWLVYAGSAQLAA